MKTRCIYSQRRLSKKIFASIFRLQKQGHSTATTILNYSVVQTSLLSWNRQYRECIACLTISRRRVGALIAIFKKTKMLRREMIFHVARMQV